MLFRNQRVICINGDWTVAIAANPRLATERLPVKGSPYYVAAIGLLPCTDCGGSHQWIEVFGCPGFSFVASRFRPIIEDRSKTAAAVSDLKWIARATSDIVDDVSLETVKKIAGRF